MTGNRSESAEGRSPRPGGVVRLYPTAYRRQHGAEIAATLADIADAEGGWGARRETAAVAGHALRMRTGLDSARPTGRALAGLAPYVVAVAASLSAALLVVWPLEPQAWDGERTYTPLAYAPWLAVLGCLIAGRWAWARIGAAAALAGAALSVPLALWSGGREGLSQNLPTVLGLAAAATAVLAAPPDLPPTAPRARRNATLTALALGVPLLVASTTVFQAVAGPGAVESARPEPVRVLLQFAPLVLAFPAALGLARSRHGGAVATVVVAAACALVYEYGLLASVPYDAGMLIGKAGFLTGLAALLIRLALRLRATRERTRAS
ncbi:MULTISPECIES: hypothetical protein [unclassified Streptomyces]|uniref:hypothetical protein n=1 Tax=unclassified Streptomyces TaxID=2593676 RepID=UPI0001C18F93|nr:MULTISPECIES: hypothetical protein [unclassified Streptomyces]AEN08135.1 hypothetical protein SACTE_0185 [Streptomyces sp. SirexAA-E]MYR68362.1 hypothetical protein [Streptomyces sp. SID4939]MYS02698.1 hypothetical protein [Streptomyces sp. SID4940]MYT66718.1 hypothetical protein [Streptomyces sp. SID8357]MYT83639.1 hypothetical protein [Streptomyces sp. SID8360]